MLKKTITYEDFNGVTRTQDYYFNLTKTELYAWENSYDGGMSVLLQRIVQEKSPSKLLEYFQKLIQMSYGEKSDDGLRFKKSPEILADFTSTNAYDVLFMELASDTKAAIAFIKGIMPADLAGAIDEKNVEESAANLLASAT
ncbi:MAG: hypothetical protein LIP10_03475 [Clostridiales bacterium]|nr:hypothetical protein [Clostridiales bacterium]